MFVEALKQFLYGWLMDLIRGQLEKAKEKSNGKTK
jgi:hypothetical protein